MPLESALVRGKHDFEAKGKSKSHFEMGPRNRIKGLSNYNNWRQSVMTLKQKIAGAELYFSRAYSSFWWSQENG